MKQIIDGKRYDTDTADEIASNCYWDGQNWDRTGRNTYLYKTPNGRFFLTHITCWEHERDSIEAISKEEAKEYFERLPEHEMSWEEAFGEEPEEA